MRFDVLLEDGEWRIVRATHAPNKPKRGRWVIMQHKCGDKRPGRSAMFDDGEWSFCVFPDKVCDSCGITIDARIVGFHSMIMWDNEEDMP